MLAGLVEAVPADWLESEALHAPGQGKGLVLVMADKPIQHQPGGFKLPGYVPRIFQSDLHSKATMANALVEAGIFETVGEARRAGWDKPLMGGLHVIGKARKLCVIYMDREPGWDRSEAFGIKDTPHG